MTTAAGPAASPEFLEKYRRAFKSCLIFGFAQIIALAVYLILEEFTRAHFRPFFGFASGVLPTGSRIVLRYAVFAAAVVCVLIVRFVHNRGVRRLAAADDPDRVLAGLSRMAMFDLTLAEIPGFLGLVLFILAGYNRDFYILLFVSLVLNFMYFPRLKTWDDILQKNPVSCPR